MNAAAESTLQSALESVGATIVPTGTQNHEPGLTVRTPDGSLLALDIKPVAVPSRGLLAAQRPNPGERLVVVADQISAAMRDELNEQGVAWLDRRGHFRLVGDGFFIDTDIPTDERTTANSNQAAISGRSGLAAAAALLLDPDDPMSVSEIARRSGLNASSISRALSTLAAAQLAERIGRGRYRPLAPELFWALADVWPRNRTPLTVGLAELTDPRLGAGIDGLGVGWAAGGERGAVAWGAPLVLTGDYPALLYVPNAEAIRVAQAISGPVTETATAARVEVRVDPIGLVTHERFPTKGTGAPLAHPLYCALDLTATARDREALDQWNPPEGFNRVW